MTTEVVPVRFNGVVGMAMRRWYIVVLGLLVTLPLSFVAAHQVAPKYTMKASVVLLVPQKSLGPGGNPYLALGGLDAAVDVLAAGLSADAIQERLALTGATAGLVQRDGGSSAPILLVTVVAPSKQTAQAGVDTLVREVAPTLASIQRSAGVDRSHLIRSEVVASSKRAAVSYKPLIRAGLMVLMAGVAATFLLTALVDSGLRRRRQRRDAALTPRSPLRVSGPVEAHQEDPDDQAQVSALDLMTARGRKR